MERVHTISTQLKRVDDSVPCDIITKVAPTCCVVCSNTDERYMITDDQLGYMICIGKDGRGCGGVVQENMMKTTHTAYTDEDTCSYELFSPQHATTSQWINGSSLYKRLNMQVERDLVKYNRDDTMTSDVYKDKQRKDVYGMLNEIHLHIDVDQNTINEVKVLFHTYRSKMYRVHKLEVALTALFYIVLCS